MRSWLTAPLFRLLAAALLLAGMSEVSKIVCISSTGHEAVEDWATACCLPGGDNPISSVSERGSCHGCRDFALVTEFAIKGRQSDLSSARAAGLSGWALALPTLWQIAITNTSVMPPIRGAESIDSAPSTTTLRC